MRRNEATILAKAKWRSKLSGQALAAAAVGLGLAIGLFGADAYGENLQAQQTKIAVTDFAFSDTSGEVQDQSAVHQARLQRFKEVLEAGLEKTGRYHVIALACPTDPCAETPAAGASLLEAARKSGATLLVVGGIHKMSSLVIFMKANVYEVAADRSVFSKLFTFRGDNDEAWVRAAEFLAREINARK